MAVFSWQRRIGFDRNEKAAGVSRILSEFGKAVCRKKLLKRVGFGKPVLKFGGKIGSGLPPNFFVGIPTLSGQSFDSCLNLSSDFIAKAQARSLL
jgi:hypothetical protein